MQYVKIKLMDKVLEYKDWASYNHSIALGTYPVIYPISDGSGLIFMSSDIKTWVNSSQMANLLTTLSNDEPKLPEPAPNPQFSESFILKLVAISKDSSLAKDLTK